jgi:hypothetical protein
MRRTVQFWQVADGSGAVLNVAFPARALVEKLQAARQACVSRYYTARDGYRMLGGGIETIPRPYVAVYRSRQVNLPGKDVAGEVVDLGLNKGEGLAEGTHFVFFPNNVVGVLYNFHGPNVRRFSAYLFHKFGLDVTFVPVYRRDIAAILEELDKMSKIELSIPANQVHLLSAADGDEFARPLAQTATILGDGNIRLEVSVGQGAGSERYEKVRSLARQLARRPDLDKFRVVKVYGRLEDESQSWPIDLKAEQLVTRKDVAPETPTSTRVSQASARAVICEVHREYRHHIRTVTAEMPSLTSSLPIGEINPEESPREGD